MAGIVIGIVVFLLLHFARQLIQLLFLGVLLVQVFLLLVVDGPFARTRYAVLFGLALIGSVLWHLCVVCPV